MLEPRMRLTRRESRAGCLVFHQFCEASVDNSDYWRTLLGGTLQDATVRLFLILGVVSLIGGTLAWLVS